jgi:hypothetical protein
LLLTIDHNAGDKHLFLFADLMRQNLHPGEKRRPSQNERLAIEKLTSHVFIQSIRGDSEGESVLAETFICFYLMAARHLGLLTRRIALFNISFILNIAADRVLQIKHS